MASRLRRQALFALVSIFGASVCTFIVFRLVPGNPARQALGQFATPAQLAQFDQQNLLNRPIPIQYWAFIRNFFTGQWGFSYASGAPVRSLILDALPASIELAVVTFAFVLIATVVLALLATYRPRPWLDRIVGLAAFFGLGAPPFWLGLILILIFSRDLHLLPGAEGQISPQYVIPPVTHFMLIDTLLNGNLPAFGSACLHLILPALTLGAGVFGFLVRILRSSLLEVSDQPFILAVRAKGVSQWTAFRRHALHNALLPTLTAGGLVFGQLLAGSILVESVFSWPGVGNLIVHSISLKDYTTVDVYVLLSAMAYVIINFAVDVLHLFVDPRVLATESSQ
jgi:ABC-type dipeptide/oligopeptide/nickel transport system permease component